MIEVEPIDREGCTVEQIIEQLEYHKSTHTEWADWLERHPEHPNQGEIGSAKFHRSVEARYSKMINGVKALQKELEEKSKATHRAPNLPPPEQE